MLSDSGSSAMLNDNDPYEEISSSSSNGSSNERVGSRPKVSRLSNTISSQEKSIIIPEKRTTSLSKQSLEGLIGGSGEQLKSLLKNKIKEGVTKNMDKIRQGRLLN